MDTTLHRGIPYSSTRGSAGYMAPGGGAAFVISPLAAGILVQPQPPTFQAARVGIGPLVAAADPNEWLRQLNAFGSGGIVQNASFTGSV